MNELAELKAAVREHLEIASDGLQDTRRDLKDLTSEVEKIRATHKNLDDVAKQVDRIETRLNRPGAAAVHRSASGLERYSIAKAIRQADSGKLDGLEGEMHAELSRGREARGVMIPATVLLGERKAQLVTPDNAGGYTVSTTVGTVADRFRPALKVEAMGATVLRGLTGFLDLPNLMASGSTKWISEHAPATRTAVTFGNVTLSPKTVSAEYEFSRRLMLQSAESIEGLLRRDLGFLLAQAIDSAAIKNRSGALTEPLGILDWPGIAKVTTESAFSDTTANCIAALEMDDVAGSAAFLTSPKVLGGCRKIKDLDTHVIPVPELFHGARVEASTQVPDNIGSGSNKSALIYGLWSELVIGYWSSIDILLNRYHQDVASRGGALLHAFLDVDCAVRHPEAFVYAEI